MHHPPTDAARPTAPGIPTGDDPRRARRLAATLSRWGALLGALGLLACASGPPHTTRDRAPERTTTRDRHASPPADKDHDGVPDTRDACPDDPEDLDRFEDEDGCPDP